MHLKPNKGSIYWTCLVLNWWKKMSYTKWFSHRMVKILLVNKTFLCFYIKQTWLADHLPFKYCIAKTSGTQMFGGIQIVTVFERIYFFAGVEV